MEIQEIKQRLSIQEVLAYYGLAMNRNKHVNCPFHEDKTPSMRVYPETGTVYCFSGRCRLHGKSLDVIELVQQKEECSKHEAIMKCKWLLNGIEGSLLREGAAPKKEFIEKLWEELVSSKSSRAKSYAKGRGLEGLAEWGYNSGRWHLRKGRSKEELEAGQALGFLLPSAQVEGHIRAWGRECMLFGLRNEGGRVVSLYGRSITGKGHYYLRDRRGLYPGYPKRSSKKVILTESVIDAASLQQVGEVTRLYAVLALYGTNGYTKEHQRALQSMEELEEVVLMLDGDEAGRKASGKLAKQLKEELPQAIVRIVELPEGTDVNELWANHLSEELFVELLGQSQEEIAKPSLELEDEQGVDLQIIKENYYIYQAERVQIEVLGGIAIEQLDRMQCTLRVSRKPQRTALDKVRQNLNLYHVGQVRGLVKRLQEELELPLQELKLVVANLLEQLEAYRNQQQQLLSRASQIKSRVVPTGRRRKALDYLKAPNLMQQTWGDLGRVGIVGERENALIMYLCFSSRKLQKPLHVISLGSSGSGKTHLQESIASLMPEEEVINMTSLSDQALYYYPEGSLRHKLFLVEDLDGMSEEAQYAMRELKSKGKLERYVPVKNQTGKSNTQCIQVEGPICFGGCTTRERVYEDNANRCLLLYRDESSAHKKAVMQEQRRAAAGKVNKLQQEQLREQFKDMQSLLEPITVVNPYAEALDLPSRIFKPLRTNAHYLQFIEVITFYHQHQRARKQSQSGVEYIETTLEDIEWANKLMKKVLLSKSDELSWGVRDFLEKLKVVCKRLELASFRNQEIRNAITIKPANLKYYLRQLVDYGHLKIVGGNRHRGFEYELLKPKEYQELKEQLNSALDKCLEQISAKQMEEKQRVESNG